ncbi:MAG: endonuclease/exonuclease/phosphatase family protein, partial [Acidimicrobiales bacterium]
MRVVTWNIQHARRPDGKADPEALAAACAAFGADVLALQEVDRGTRRIGGADLLALIAEATGLHLVDGTILRYRGGTYGNALLVRGTTAEEGKRRLPRPSWPPWDRPEPRGMVWARWQDMFVAACHLDPRRRRAARQLPVVLRRLARRAHAAPALLLGDLNLVPLAVEPVATRYGFELLSVPTAYPADEPREAIDHVLVRGLT